MKRWVDLMTRHGGGPILCYNDNFFKWMKKQLIMVEEYAYKGMDFQGDPDIILPMEYQWNAVGRKEAIFKF
jgi:hypothetical protein